MDKNHIWALFFYLGLIFIIISLLMYLEKLPFLNKIGKMPGDLHIHKGNFHFYFPLTSSILVSLVITAIINVFKK